MKIQISKILFIIAKFEINKYDIVYILNVNKFKPKKTFSYNSQNNKEFLTPKKIIELINLNKKDFESDRL